MTEPKNCGINEIWIPSSTDLKALWKRSMGVRRDPIQTCIVHLIRNSRNLSSWKERKPVAKEHRTIYRGDGAQAANSALQVFENGRWGASLSQSLLRDAETGHK